MRFIPLVVALLLTPSQVTSARPELWAGLQPGKYSVGYRVVESLKPATSVWYPAVSKGAPMNMRAYLGKGVDAFVKFLKSASLPDAAITRYLDSPLAARLDAAPAPGSFPIIALGQGNGQSAPDQAVLAEFLASHGYLVVTTASPMIETPITVDRQVPLFSEYQANDLERGMESLSKWPSANAAVRFAIGHSFGARPALLLAMRDPRIRGVVSLDGGIGSSTARRIFMAARSYNAKKATAPILHFYEEIDAFTAPDMTLLKSLPGVVTLRSLPGMHHSDFTTFGFGAVVIPEMAKATKARPELRDSLMQMTRETLAFLERYRR